MRKVLDGLEGLEAAKLIKEQATDSYMGLY